MTEPEQTEDGCLCREHDPILKGDWCFRGICRRCGHDMLADLVDAPKACSEDTSHDH